MGTPTSAIFSKIFLQYSELNYTLRILIRNNIVYYLRYVDDIITVTKVPPIRIRQTLLEF